MTRYTNFTNANIRGSKRQAHEGIESNCEYITRRFKFVDLLDEDVIALTNSQVDGLVEAYAEKKGMTIRMSKTQLAHNMKIEGGFGPALAGLIPFLNRTVLPALGVGALSGLANTGVQKLTGNSLYLKNVGSVCVGLKLT